jgi:hypothetical protein
MTQYGFWKLAQEDPAHVALIDPKDGRSISAGELLASANQVVHGLRALGLRAGDTIAAAMSNEPAMLELYLAATQAGLYLTPINSHLAAPEIAYIAADCDAKALLCSEASAEACAKARRELSLPDEALLLHRGFPRLSSLRRAHARAAHHAPRGAARRRLDDLHLGHHGQAQGRAPPARRCPARARRLQPRDVPDALRRHPAGRRRAPRRRAALPHGRAQLLHEPPALRPHRGAHGSVDAGGRARSHRAPPRHQQPHGADAFPPAAGAPRGAARRGRRLVAAPRHPQRRALPRRREARDARMVGAGDLRVLRGVGGRRHAGHGRAVARAPGHRRQGLADLPASHRPRRGRRPARPARWAPCT